MAKKKIKVDKVARVEIDRMALQRAARLEAAPSVVDEAKKPEPRRTALGEIEGKQSEANDRSVIEMFKARGFEIEDIVPRENVRTRAAWLDHGRDVYFNANGVVLKLVGGSKRTATPGRAVRLFHVSETYDLATGKDR